MTDQGITLNIYDKPPKLNDNTNDNINDKEPELNLNTNRLPEYPNNLDNIRDNTRNELNSAPRPNYGRSTLEGTGTTGTTNSSIDSTTNPNNTQSPIPMQPYPIIYQQPPVIPTPMVRPVQYSPQYGQPVILQQRNIQPQQPKTVIIKETQKGNKKQTEDCCAGFLAGIASCCAICCLLMLCSGGGGGRYHGGRRGGRW